MSGMVVAETVAGRIEARRIGVAEYDRMIAAGASRDHDAALEWLHGSIVREDCGARGEDPMSIGDRHVVVVRKIAALARRLPEGAFVPTQQPVPPPPDGEPAPDGLIIAGEIATAPARARPPRIRIAIEAVDSSLETDCRPGRRGYATAGIPQYVLVNIPDASIENRTGPVPPSGQYHTEQVISRGQTLELMLGAVCTLQVPAVDLLP